MVATVLVSSRLTPVYESTATIDMDRQTPTGVIGQDAMRSTANDADQFLATQIKLIQSDSVLRPVVNRLNLLEREPDAVERVENAAAEAKEAPLVLKRLKVARPANTYLLLISYRSPDPQLAADVANGIAQSYLEHTYDIRYRSSASLSAFMEKQLEELKAKMERSATALVQFERELNVINPEEKTSILSARLLQLNTEYTNAQADRVRKEAAYHSTRNGRWRRRRSPPRANALKAPDRAAQRSQAEIRRGEDPLRRQPPRVPPRRRAGAPKCSGRWTAPGRTSRTGSRSSTGRRVDRERMLAEGGSSPKAEFDSVNARSFEYQSLKREAEADKKLYEELVRKIKEAGINASFQNSSIRIADAAAPRRQAGFPNIKLNAFLAFLFSSVLALGAAVRERSAGQHDPRPRAGAAHAEYRGDCGSLPVREDLAGSPGPVIASSPADPWPWWSPKTTAGDALSSYDEAIRTLRNSILLADFDRRLRSLLVTSASPGEGKSTIAAHWPWPTPTRAPDAADRRRPAPAQRRDSASTSPRALGLSNVLGSELPWRDALVKFDGAPHLDILPAGPPSRRAADLIGRGMFELLEEAVREYDLVILDAPPLARLRRTAANGNRGGRRDGRHASRRDQPQGGRLGDFNAPAACASTSWGWCSTRSRTT